MTFDNLFETLSYEDLLAYIESQQEEHLHLDFKTVKGASFASRDDHRNLAVSIAGFANSAGGLIIWGVDARKNSEGIDCAISLAPIEQPALFLSRLNELSGNATEPALIGVRHRLLEDNKGKACAVTLVPESDIGPHMAKLGENRYYKRIGDSFYKMEHYDIADMFGKRRKPRLRVVYKVHSASEGIAIDIGLKNEGRATARAPFLAFENEGPFQRSVYGLDGNRGEGLPRLPIGSFDLRCAYGGGMDLAIHPGMSWMVAALTMGFPSRPPPDEDVVIRFAVACEDQLLERASLIIPASELR